MSSIEITESHLNEKISEVLNGTYLLSDNRDEAFVLLCHVKKCESAKKTDKLIFVTVPIAAATLLYITRNVNVLDPNALQPVLLPVLLHGLC